MVLGKTLPLSCFFCLCTPFQKYDLGYFLQADLKLANSLSQPPKCWGWLQMCTTSSSLSPFKVCLACFTSTLLWRRPSFLHEVHFPGHLSPPCQVLSFIHKAEFLERLGLPGNLSVQIRIPSCQHWPPSAAFCVHTRTRFPSMKTIDETATC